MTTVLIVDDHAAYRSALRATLEHDGFEVIGESPDGERALVDVALAGPDIVLLDIQLPGIDGFEVADRLCGRPDRPIVILISSRRSVEFSDLLVARPWLRFLAKDQLSGEAVRELVR